LSASPPPQAVRTMLAATPEARRRRERRRGRTVELVIVGLPEEVVVADRRCERRVECGTRSAAPAGQDGWWCSRSLE
jgi:hypothetical protein